MLISPPERLLQAGMKVKHTQAAAEGGGLWVLWIGAAVVGLAAVYTRYRRQQALAAATQRQAVAQAAPAKRNVLQDWQRAFSG